MPFGSELASAAAFWNRVNSVLLGVGIGIGVLYVVDNCEPARRSCHRTVAECTAFCAPRGGISSVTHPNTRNCRPRGADAAQRRVLCVCQRP